MCVLRMRLRILRVLLESQDVVILGLLFELRLRLICNVVLFFFRDGVAIPLWILISRLLIFLIRNSCGLVSALISIASNFTMISR